MQPKHRYPFYIRVLNVDLFNMLVASAETRVAHEQLQTSRRDGYYELRMDNGALWKELYLYGQIIAQAQDDFIDAGEDKVE